jgi:hypothetical protein
MLCEPAHSGELTFGQVCDAQAASRRPAQIRGGKCPVRSISNKAPAPLGGSVRLTAAGDLSTGPKVASPTVGKPYTVWVEIQNFYPDPDTGGWNLFVCWGIPFTGTLPSVNIGQILNGAVTSAGPQGAPITVTIPGGTLTSPGIVTLPAATTWTPTLQNGGHECLVAAVYDEQAIGGLPTSILLDGDATWNQSYSVAQNNLSVVPATMMMGHIIQYPFQVWNAADEDREFIVEAWQAPLSQIADFLPGVPGGRKVMENPGKVNRLGLLASDKAQSTELEKAPPRVAGVKVPKRSARPFTLGVKLDKGNALIHVTQSQKGRIVGGLSVLAMAEGK